MLKKTVLWLGISKLDVRDSMGESRIAKCEIVARLKKSSTP